MFFIGLTILPSVTGVNSLSCVSMSNQECKTRSQVVNVNRDEPVFLPFSIKTSKCSGSCNNMYYQYEKLCVPDVVKNVNVKVFNLISRTNETRHIEWHETCKYECKFGANICNNRQRWNKDNCRCECKELIDKGACDKGFIWNPSNCECECDKSCDVGDFLDYENCKCRQKLADKLVDDCAETVEEVKLAKITLVENENMYKCSSCTVYIVLIIVVFTICAGIVTYFVYYNWTLVKFNNRIKTRIYWTNKWGKSNKLTLKIKLIIFITT